MTNVFDHPWLGGLFGDAETQAIWAPERQLGHMLAVEAAYSRALGAAGLVSPDSAAAAAKHIAAFRPDMAALRDGTGADGLPVPALVHQLRADGGPLQDAIHTGATSQDVIDTALVLSLRDLSDLLDARLQTLGAALDDLTERFGQNPLMGRTRMQAALPMTVADRMRSWRAPLSAHRARLADIRPTVQHVQLGGAVGDTRQMLGKGPQITQAVAADLGLTAPPHAWHAMRDGLVDYAGLLSLITGTLGKVGQDICLMAQQGIDEITLSGGGGSSAMVHKTNPVLAELLVTLARFNATQVAGMHHALVHEQERSGSAWALEWMLLPQMALATGRALSASQTLSTQITHMGRPGA